MSTLNHQSRKRGILILFILLLCSLMAFQFMLPTRAMTGEANIPQETSSPSPEGDRSTKAQKAVKIVIDWLMSRRVKSLLEKGPQFPERFDTRDFSVEVLLKGRWPVAIEYELEPEATASIIVTVKGAQPFSLSLPATGTGQPRATSFILPDYFGDQLLPAKISFKAEKQSSPAHELALFELYALAIGPDVVKPANPYNQQFNSKNQFATASDSFQAAHHSSFAKAQRSAVVDRVIFDRPGINVRAGEVVAYSFQPAADFQKWSATFFSFSASSLSQRAVYEFRELISQSTLVRKTWNGKNERNRPVPAGIYKVLIRAWRSVGGQSASASSQQNVRVN